MKRQWRTKVSIGYLQCAPALGNVNETIGHIDALIRSAEGADILVLPELCNSGYNFVSYDQAQETSEEIENSIFVRYLESQCMQFKIHIVSGFNERDHNDLYNSAILVGPDGYIGTYRKLHLFMNEKDYFKPGNRGLPVFNIGTCTIGMLVCFDWIFPEAWRILALKGADIICHPSNLVLPGLAQRAIPIHALINRIFIVTANRIGAERDLTFTGLSIIADPQGDILDQASQKDAELGIQTIDIAMARNKMITQRNDVLGDRKPEHYSLLAENI